MLRFTFENSLTAHLMRGLIGILLVIAAIANARWTPFGIASTVVVSGLALLMFRGCPICWTVGLFEEGSKKQTEFARRNDS